MRASVASFLGGRYGRYNPRDFVAAKSFQDRTKLWPMGKKHS
jgi:hypothetical protein